MKKFKPHQIHTACFAAIVAFMASFTSSQAIAQGAYGQEYSGSQSISEPITGVVSGSGAGIYIHDLNNGSHSLTIGDGSTQTTISSTGNGTVTIGSVDPRQDQSAASGLLITRSPFDSVTISKNSTVSGINGVSLIRESAGVQEGGSVTIKSFVNNGRVEASGSFTGYTTTRDTIFTAGAALMVGGAWNPKGTAAAMVVKKVENNGSLISATQNGNGIWVGMAGKIESIENSGTISGKYAGIYLQYSNITNGWYYKSEIGSINSSGTISGGSYGIYLNNGYSADRNAQLGDVTLTSGGSITGGQGGILATKYAKVGSITISDTSKIEGSNSSNGYGIQALASAQIQSITITDNAKITGGVAGVNLGWATISGGVTLNGSTGSSDSGALISGGTHGITSDGVIYKGITLSGKSSIVGTQGQGINNTGRIDVSGTGTDAIKLTDSSTISGGQFGVYNNGDIIGNITVDTGSKIVGKTYGIYNDSKGNISGAIAVSGGLSGVYNKGTIAGALTVVGKKTTDFTFYNEKTVSGELKLEVTGDVVAQNKGLVSGAATISTDKSITFSNESTVSGAISLTGKQVNFSNTGSFLEALTITASGAGTDNSFSNTQQLDMDLTLNISGNLTFTNSGRITKALALSRAGTLDFSNNASIDNNFTIGGSGAVNLTNGSNGRLQTVGISGAQGLTLTNQGTITGLLTVSGAGNAGEQKDYSVSNSGAIEKGLSGANFKSISIVNTGSSSRLLDAVSVSGSGAMTLRNEGTRSGATTLSGSGAFTLANTNSWQGDITITGATGMQLTNTGSVTADQTSISGSGDFSFANASLWQGAIEASGAKTVTINNQGDFSLGNGQGTLLKVLGTQSGNLSFTNTQNWDGNFEISGVQAMTVLNNGTVTAPNSSISGSGDFTFTNTKSWTGDLTVTGAQDVTIENPGTFSGNLTITKAEGGTAGKVLFNNAGEFKGSATIDFAGDESVITNTGLYQGSLTLKGTGTVSVVSKNLWGGTINQLGPNSKLQIKEWVVAVTGTDGEYNVVNTVNVTQITDSPLSRSTRSAQNDGIQLDKVIISYADPTKSNVSYSIDLNKVLVVNGGTTDADTIKPTEAVLAPDVQAMGFQGKYYYDEGLYRTTFDTGVTAGAIVSKTMASQLFRRDFFVEAAINESAVGSMYHRRLDGIKGTVFVKPYFSYDTFSEDQVRASGHTQGVMAGMTGFLGRHIVTGIVGYERSQIGTNYLTSDLDLDMQSWYASLMTSHIMFSNRFFDAFGKVTAKASYTQSDITRTLSTLNSEADTKAYSYGANLQMGANIRGIPGGNIIPMIGVGYAMGLTQDYQLDNTGTINDKYIPDNIKLPFADASVTWFQSWNSIVKTFVSAGYRYNLKPTQKTAVQFGANTIHGEFQLPKHYQYINSSIVLHMTKDSELAIGYTGVMDETGKSHNLTTKYEIHF